MRIQPKLSKLALLLFLSTTAAFAQITISPSPIPPAVVGQVFGGFSTQQLAYAAGGTASSYSWSLVSGSLPPGLTLSATTSDAVTGAITGTITAPGTFAFTLSVTDNNTPAQTVTQAFTMAVTVGPLTISPASLPGGVLGQPYLAAGGASVLAGIGGIEPYSWSLVSGSLPPGISLAATTPDSVTGALSGTPTAPGTFSFTLVLKDSSPTQLTIIQTFALTVASLVEYPEPSGAGPVGIAAAPDGALWYTGNAAIVFDTQGNSIYPIGRVTTSGIFNVPPFGIPQVLSGGQFVPIQGQLIIPGSDSALWFTEPNAGNIGRLATNGSVDFQYQLPQVTITGYPYQLTPNGIVSGPDGAIWFTIYAAFAPSPYGAIGRIATTSDHHFSYFPITTNANTNPGGIAAGPDGALWFTDTGLDQNGNPLGYIGRITPDGKLAPPAACSTSPTLECPIMGASLVGGGLNSIVAGPDGALWFTDSVSNQIGRITTDGKTVNLYTVPTQGANPSGLTVGSDGALWFTENLTVGRITTSGVITEFPTSTNLSNAITQGPDGALWFTESSAIGRIAPPLDLACNLPSSEQVGQVLSGTGCPAIGGKGPYAYTISTGTLPPGLSLDPSTGAITGTPSNAGAYSFTVQATDSGSPAQTASRIFNITAAPRQALSFSCVFSAGAQSSLPYTATCTTAGGIPPYGYSISAGALPPGLALTPTATGATISGTPTTYGSFSFAVQASDSGSPVFTATQQAQSFSVLPPPLVFNCTITAKAEVNVPFAHQCSATGGIPPYNFTLSTNAPSGLAIDPAGGLITGTLSAAGTFPFTVQVHDSGPPVQTATVQASLVVIPPRLGLMCDFTKPPVLGVAYATSCPATNGTAPLKYVLKSGALPPGLTLDPATGSIGGKATTAGTFAFTVGLTDGESPAQTAIQNASVFVAPVTLTITSKSLPAAAVNLAYSANPSASGGTPPYKWSVSAGTLPAGFFLAPTTGAITGTPIAGGAYSFTLQVSDSSHVPQTAIQALSGTISGALVPNFTEYPLPVASGANALTSGPDGALWFTTPDQPSGNLIGGITTKGLITLYPAPNPLSKTPLGQGLTVGPDGTLWFTERSANLVGQITVDGSLSLDYPVTTTGAGPQEIAAGPDGALWFTEAGASQIGHISSTGQILNEYLTVTAASGPSGIAVGPDNALWFTEASANQIGRITTDGQTKNEYPILTTGATPASIAVGPDGALWFTESGAAKIGRISTAGKITEYDTPTPASGPQAIAAGADGALYFTETTANQLGRITTAGVVTEYPLPASASGPLGISLGSDGAIWIAENSTSKIARFVFAPQLSFSCTFPTSGSVPANSTYSATCTTANGIPPYSYSISSGTLPPGVNQDSATGSLSGTLSTPGTYSFTVQASDSGAPAQTASQVAPAITVLPGALTLACSIPNTGQVGTAYSGTCTPAAGTPPYTFTVSAGALPGGLALDPVAGTLTGTPTTPGTFTFTIQVNDSGSPVQVATLPFSIAVQFGSTTGGGGPLFSLSGLPASQAPGQNIAASVVTLNQTAPVPVTGTLAITFLPFASVINVPTGYMDPALQFLDAKGNKLGVSTNLTFPPNAAAATVPAIDPGSVAGTITLTLTSNGVTQATSAVAIVPTAPVIEPGSVQLLNFTPNGFDVEFVATSVTRDATVAVFTFNPASGSSILGETTFQIDVSSVVGQWFNSDSGLSYGGNFSLTVPFQLSGPASAISSVSVTLTNSVGASAPVSGTH